jgi:hypothetical protein
LTATATPNATPIVLVRPISRANLNKLPVQLREHRHHPLQQIERATMRLVIHTGWA